MNIIDNRPSVRGHNHYLRENHEEEGDTIMNQHLISIFRIALMIALRPEVVQD
jgi:hypothetical protein